MLREFRPIDRKGNLLNDSNVLFNGNSNYLYRWDTESKDLRKIFTPSYRIDDPLETFIRIRDYNDKYILYSSLKGEPQVALRNLTIRLYNYVDEKVHEVDTNYQMLDFLDFQDGDICLCSDMMVAYASALNNTIELIDLESGRIRQIPHMQFYMNNHIITCRLRYFERTNILQVYQANVVYFYSLFDLNLVAKLRVFNDDNYIFTSYKDPRYFYSRNPEETVRVVNKIYQNEVLDSNKLKTFIREFNNWQHFYEMLFGGPNTEYLDFTGLSGKERPLPLSE